MHSWVFRNHRRLAAIYERARPYGAPGNSPARTSARPVLRVRELIPFARRRADP